MGNIVCKSKPKAEKYKDTNEIKTAQTAIQKQENQPVQLAQSAQPIQPVQPAQQVQKRNSNEKKDIIIKCELEKIVKCFFKDYKIVWHDPNVNSQENKQFLDQLKKFCPVITFTEWEEASKYIEKASASYHVITSGTNGELLVKKICSSPSVLEVYIFCANKDYHSSWSKNYRKVSCVETQIQNVLDQIEQNLLRWYMDASSLKTTIPAFAPIFNNWDKSDMNSRHLFLKVLPNFKNRSQAKNDFLALARAIYSDEVNISLMADFEQNYEQYNKESILKWYTEESFLYKVTNNCLRIATSDSIQYCRFLLKDIEQAIKEQYKEISWLFQGLLYRGAYLSEEEWSSLKGNLGRDIEMHGFLSASKDQSVALDFLQTDPSKKIFITIVVPRRGIVKTEQGFAEIEKFARFPREKEVLFNVRSRFTVLETEDTYSEDLSYRHLVLLYGAQEFREYVTRYEDLSQRFEILNTENLLCANCQISILDTPIKMLFLPLSDLQNPIYFCKQCLPNVDSSSLLCIPLMNNEKKKQYVTGIKGHQVTYYSKNFFQVPFYGYQCSKCQAKKQSLYFKCTECNQGKLNWCENCLEYLSDCTNKDHAVVLERIPFSFWCERLPEKERSDLKFENFALKNSFQQGRMFTATHQYRKAIEYYKAYIEQHQNNKHTTNIKSHLQEKKNEKLFHAYNKLAELYHSKGEFQKALNNYSKSLDTCKKDNDSPHAALTEIYQSMVYCDMGKYKEALECYSRSKKLYNQLESKKHAFSMIYFTSLGNLNFHQAEYQKALDFYSKALERAESFFGDKHPHTASPYCKMGEVYVNQAEYQKALEHYSKALEIYKSFYGDNHPDIATCYNSLGCIYSSRKGSGEEYQKALEFHSQALKICNSLFVSTHPNIASCYLQKGDTLFRFVQFNRALKCYSQALNAYKSYYEEDHLFVAKCYRKLAVINYNQAKYQKALEYHYKAFEIHKSFYGDNHPVVAYDYNMIGQVENKLAEYKKALDHCSRALEIYKSFYGENHPHLADALTGLGKTHFFLDDQDKALEYYFKSLEIKKSIFNDHHPDIASIYCNIGHAYNKLEEQSKALEYHLKSLEIKKKTFFANHPEIAESYSGIGRVHSSLGEYEKALKYHFKSLKIMKFVFHKDHPDVATCSHDIANVLKSQGKQNEAFEYYSKSWKIRKLAFGDTHPDTIIVSREIQSYPRF